MEKRRPEKSSPVIIMFHKPKECVSSRKDPQGRKTIYDFLPDQFRNIFHIGRLDYHSEGLMLLTNDGILRSRSQNLNPQLRKYMSKGERQASTGILEALRKGVRIEGRKTLPAFITFIRNSHKNTWYRVQIHEGKNRQIRKMFETLRHRF